MAESNSVPLEDSLVVRLHLVHRFFQRACRKVIQVLHFTDVSERNHHWLVQRTKNRGN